MQIYRLNKCYIINNTKMTSEDVKLTLQRLMKELNNTKRNLEYDRRTLITNKRM